MRKELDAAITSLASGDPSVVIVVADLGKFDAFRAEFPERFFNVGVAEPNSVGVAAGLASQGKRVFLFGVAGFTLYRAYEQLKFSVGYWNQRVCLIGTGFGWRYHRIGRGHHAPDDIALARLVPNMRVFAPTTADGLPRLIEKEPSGPLYLRLGQGFTDPLLATLPETGTDVVVLALGELVQRAAAAVEAVRRDGLDVGLLGVEEVSPCGVRRQLEELGPTPRLVVLEDHVAQGGLASVVREAGFRVHAHRHLPLDVSTITSTEEALLKHYGFDSLSLAEFLRSCGPGHRPSECAE